jgi:hypothetical protein
MWSTQLIKALILGLAICLNLVGAITYHNSASLPTDPGTNTGATPAVTPPASMSTADLVVFCAFTRDSSGVSMAISESSGQSWNALTLIQNTNISHQCFWARYNGTWGSDPSIAVTGGSSPYSAVMHVFRPSDTGKVWSVDVAEVEADFTATTTITVTGQTTISASTVTIATWVVPDDVIWINLAGTGWTLTGSAQYRNTSGSDQSSTYAHKIQTSAGATGNVSKDQSTNGPDAGTSSIVTFAEADPPARSRAVLIARGRP